MQKIPCLRATRCAIIVREKASRSTDDLPDRMVAAYVIGFSIAQEDLDQNPALKFAEGAEGTGVIVSWNMEGPENQGADSAVVTAGAIAINPITWTRDDAYAPAGDNPGSRIQYLTKPQDVSSPAPYCLLPLYNNGPIIKL